MRLANNRDMWLSKIKEYGRQFNDIVDIHEASDTSSFSLTPLGTFTQDDINRIEYSIDSGIFKSDMGKLVIDIKKSSSNFNLLQKNRMIRYRLQLLNDDGSVLDTCDYKFFMITDIEEQEDQKSVLVTCYDDMIRTMINYETPYTTSSRTTHISYPISVRNYIYSLMRYFNLRNVLQILNNAVNLSNEITSEHYLDSDGNSLGYTFRDIFDDLSEVTGTRIYIDYYTDTQNNKVYRELTMKQCFIDYSVSSSPIISEEYFNDKNVKLGKKIGPYNVVVLSRASDSDNLYYPATLPSNPYELKISDNLILEQDNREDFIQGIYNQVNGLEFYVNDFATKGINIFEVGDLYKVRFNNINYKCLMLHDNVKRTTGLIENINTDEPKESVTDYKYASYSDKVAITSKNAKILVDKANASIEQIVTAVGDNGEVTTASIVQSINDSGSQIKLNANKVYINGVTFDNQQNMTITKGTINVEQAPGDRSLYTWYRDNYSNALDEAEIIPPGLYTSRTGSNDNTDSSARYTYSDMQISDNYGTLYANSGGLSLDDSNNNTTFQIQTGNAIATNGITTNNTGYRAQRTDKSVDLFFGIGSGGINRGIYDTSQSKWLFVNDGTNNIINGDLHLSNKLYTSSSGREDYSSAGFTYDSNGNMTHKRDTAGDSFHIDNYNGTAVVRIYVETGDVQIKRNVSIDGTITASNFSDSGWVNCTTSQGTWSYCKVRKIGKMVELRGYASSLANPTGTIFTIPSGYRPNQQLYVTGHDGFGTGYSISRWYVRTDGICGIDWCVHLNNGSIKTGATWKSIQATWFID